MNAVVLGVVGLDEQVGHVARRYVRWVAPTVVVGNFCHLSLFGPLHIFEILGKIVVIYVASANGDDECRK